MYPPTALPYHDAACLTSAGVNWPTHFEGSALRRILAPGHEALFANDFPGEIASFTSAGRLVVLRHTHRSTRRLHSSESRLRSAGYRITSIGTDPDGWLCYYAYRSDERLHVRERISASSGTRTWTTPANWFWHATLLPRSGPWLATTVITPVRGLKKIKKAAPSGGSR